MKSCRLLKNLVPSAQRSASAMSVPSLQARYPASTVFVDRQAFLAVERQAPFETILRRRVPELISRRTDKT